MNRSKENNKAATFLLIIFFLLSLLKTVMSGVGIDLVSRSGEIKNAAAARFIPSAELLYENNNLIYKSILASANKECNKFIDKQSQLNTSKRAQRRLYNDLQEKMYRKPSNPKSFDLHIY